MTIPLDAVERVRSGFSEWMEPSANVYLGFNVIVIGYIRFLLYVTRVILSRWLHIEFMARRATVHRTSARSRAALCRGEEAPGHAAPDRSTVRGMAALYGVRLLSAGDLARRGVRGPVLQLFLSICLQRETLLAACMRSTVLL